jgi:predicted dehydrogenase
MNYTILIVGCGSIGERHLRCFQRTGRAEVAACDTNVVLLQRVAQQYGVQQFVDFRVALAARKYDGIVIATPAHTHIALALAALQHGAAVFIEKPLSTNFDKVDDLCNAAVRSQQYVAVAYVYHVMPWILGAREFVRSGKLGIPMHVTVTAGQHFPTFRPAYREIYYTRHESGGGAIQDALTHIANVIEWLVGPTTRLFCDAAHQVLEGVTVEDTVNVTAHNGNVLVNYALNQFQAPNEMTLTVHCEAGSVRVEGHEQRWSVFRRGAKEWEHHKAAPLERDDIFIAQANAFLDGMRGKLTPLATLGEAAQTLKFNLAALESARSGKAIEIS